MKKLLLCSGVLTVFSISMILFQFSCKKDASAQRTTNSGRVSNGTVAVCDVRGTYSGTSTASTGATSTLAYVLKDNNFAVGSLKINSTPTTFGGYSNTCDSVIMSVHYNDNNSYYLLQGKLRHNDSVIMGTFKNLTILSDSGTFTIRKR